MKKLRIDGSIFDAIFERDLDLQVCPFEAYLHLETGEILLVYESDDDANGWFGIPEEENQKAQQTVEDAPDQYLEIPGFSHGEHHELLRAFFDSDWTKNENEKKKVREAYTGSIGDWKASVPDPIVWSWHNFMYETMVQKTAEFLHENDIEPEWH